MEGLTASRVGVELELGGLGGLGLAVGGQVEGRMEGSLLKWLGHGKPPAVGVGHKVWGCSL